MMMGVSKNLRFRLEILRALTVKNFIGYARYLLEAGEDVVLSGRSAGVDFEMNFFVRLSKFAARP